MGQRFLDFKDRSEQAPCCGVKIPKNDILSCPVVKFSKSLPCSGISLKKILLHHGNLSEVYHKMRHAIRNLNQTYVVQMASCYRVSMDPVMELNVQK